MAVEKSAPARPVLWRTAVDAPELPNAFRYDDARSLNVVRDLDGRERPFATSPMSTAFLKSTREGGPED